MDQLTELYMKLQEEAYEIQFEVMEKLHGVSALKEIPKDTFDEFKKLSIKHDEIMRNVMEIKERREKLQS